MTKREICERLFDLRDQSSQGHLGPVGIMDALRDPILDISALEEEQIKPNKHRPQRWPEYETPCFGENTQETDK